jgi:hypothetical protein
MINRLNAIQKKAHKVIEKDTEAFLKAGGKIEELPITRRTEKKLVFRISPDKELDK